MHAGALQMIFPIPITFEYLRYLLVMCTQIPKACLLFLFLEKKMISVCISALPLMSLPQSVSYEVIENIIFM